MTATTEQAAKAPGARRHSWGNPVSIHPEDSLDKNERTERTCMHLLCGLVKITVHGPKGTLPWREWRHRSGATWVGAATPPCLDERAP